MSKAKVCMIGLFLICLFGALSFIWPERAAQLPALLTAIGGLTGSFFAVQAVNNGIKGKYWNQAMHDAENKLKENTNERGNTDRAS